jgi:hypothetical protein
LTVRPLDHATGGLQREQKSYLDLLARHAEALLAVRRQRVPEELEVGPLTLARSPNSFSSLNRRYAFPAALMDFVRSPVRRDGPAGP